MSDIRQHRSTRTNRKYEVRTEREENFITKVHKATRHDMARSRPRNQHPRNQNKRRKRALEIERTRTRARGVWLGGETHRGLKEKAAGYIAAVGPCR